MARFRVGVDIGGTFTDIVFLNAAGELHTKKVSSSVDDYARAIIEGLDEVMREHRLTPADVSEVLHATTVASNAILEHKGAKTGLITTKGFRDVLEIRRLRMPRLYDLAWEKPVPLVERYLRREVEERLDAKGNVQVKLKEADVRKELDFLLKEKIEALAVCLLHSYANPAHEKRIKEIVQKRAPKLLTCISSEVLPEIREYERTSTTVINAYVMPIVRTYLARLRSELDRAKIKAPLLLMQSNGGLTPSEAAAEMPCNVIESGPAAGVVGSQQLAHRMGLGKVISFDMGGTTAKASLIENGEVTRASEYQVGAGIMIGSRLLTGAGYLLKVPAIDLAEVGAGGGSHVWIDPAGSLQVGPTSAGAVPGPVCYDIGGTEPTVTDANVVLGYINPEFLCGGEVKLNAAKSHKIFADTIAKRLGLEVAHAALGAHKIAASNMIRAIKAVSSERGRDPREYALFAFGGNGPLFAAGIAESLQMRRIVVPPSPGVFSSFGLLYSEVEHHYSRTHWCMVRTVDPKLVARVVGGMEKEAMAQLKADGFTAAESRAKRAASMRYQGQSYELTVPMPDGPVTRHSLVELEERFGQEHERTYGHRAGPEEPVEVVSFHVVGQGIPTTPRVPERIRIDEHAAATRPSSRRAYFGPEAGWIELPVIGRTDLRSRRKGPCIVEEYDATCIIPADGEAEVDDYGNIVIDLKPA
ncbi:MAG: hydantoinase/oxoprolinase family protein [Proteobacteria bacterium]|nr:hydantoinase/oxoprolinase family protein [Pseudomonadota bacterium]